MTKYSASLSRWRSSIITSSVCRFDTAWGLILRARSISDVSQSKSRRSSESSGHISMALMMYWYASFTLSFLTHEAVNWYTKTCHSSVGRSLSSIMSSAFLKSGSAFLHLSRYTYIWPCLVRAFAMLSNLATLLSSLLLASTLCSAGSTLFKYLSEPSQSSSSSFNCASVPYTSILASTSSMGLVSKICAAPIRIPLNCSRSCWTDFTLAIFT
mmetsp:Transcript_751/g.1275  ORF Transcript_751/g.1275 Transcript_751/m.1275 type:complete len:213 (-) Transcript_751:65-703(-)